MELAFEGIRFTAVCPGAVETGIFDGHPPADAMSPAQAASIVLDGVERNEHLIVFPDKWESIHRQYVNEFPAFEAYMTREINAGYAAAAIRSDPGIREAASRLVSLEDFMRFSAETLRRVYGSREEAEADYGPFKAYVADMIALHRGETRESGS